MGVVVVVVVGVAARGGVVVVAAAVAVAAAAAVAVVVVVVSSSLLLLLLLLLLVVVVVVVVVVIVVAVVVVVGTNKDWGPQDKLPELILEFAWCSLRASMEFSTVLKKNFGVDFWLLFLVGIKLPGLLCDRSAAEVLQKRRPAGPLWIIILFLVAGPLEARQRLKTKKGV